VAKHWRCWGKYHMAFVVNLSLVVLPEVNEFWNSVKNWLSYRHVFGVLLFGIQCILLISDYSNTMHFNYSALVMHAEQISQRTVNVLKFICCFNTLILIDYTAISMSLCQYCLYCLQGREKCYSTNVIVQIYSNTMHFNIMR